NRATRIATLVSGAALVWAGGKPATAQIDTSGNAQYAITPYLWALSLHGRVGVGPVAANNDISFGDIWRALRFATMINGEVRYNHFVGTVDLIYASLGKEAVVAFRGDTGTLELTGKIAILQPLGGYSIGNQKWSVDFLGGFRQWFLKPTLD